MNQINLLIPLNSKENTLANVTKKLVKRLIVREHKIMGYEKEVKSFETGKVTPPHSATLSPNPDSEIGVEDLISYNQEYVEHKVEELKFAIRKEKIEKNKIEACLSLLKESGVDTDKILLDARSTVAAATEMMIQNNRNQELSYQSANLNTSQTIDNPEYDEELSQINNDDCYQYSLSKYSGYEYPPLSVSSSPNMPQSYASTVTKSSGSTESINNINNISNINTNHDDDHTSNHDEDNWVGDGGFGRAVAMFEFHANANQWEETDLVVNEEVILLNETDSGGWIKVRSLIDGREGIVPVSYLNILHQNSVRMISLESEKNNIDYENIADYANVVPLNKMSCVDPSMDTNIPINEEDLVKAACAFCGTNSDELQLEKGDVIKVMNRVSQDGVDDGWWEGFKVQWCDKNNTWISSKRGFFPSMVVRKYLSTTMPKPDQSPLCPRIKPRKRPTVKLDFGIINAMKHVADKTDNPTTETDIVGDYVRLASETEQTPGDNDVNLEIKEL